MKYGRGQGYRPLIDNLSKPTAEQAKPSRMTDKQSFTRGAVTQPKREDSQKGYANENENLGGQQQSLMICATGHCASESQQMLRFRGQCLNVGLSVCECRGSVRRSCGLLVRAKNSKLSHSRNSNAENMRYNCKDEFFDKIFGCPDTTRWKTWLA